MNDEMKMKLSAARILLEAARDVWDELDDVADGAPDASSFGKFGASEQVARLCNAISMCDNVGIAGHTPEVPR